MASLLSGIELLEDLGFYSVVFPFILIVAIVYGFLSYFKPFGDNQAVSIVISVMFGLLFISARSAVRFVNMFIPFVMVIFLVMILILIVFRFAGADEGMISEALKHSAGYGSIIGILIVGIFIFIGLSFPELTPSNQPESSDGTSSGGSDSVGITQDVLRQTIFHPTIVGMIVMVLVFGAATYVVTSRPP